MHAQLQRPAGPPETGDVDTGEVGAEALLEAARNGDLASFAGLVRLHQGRVFSVALRFTGRREDAEELAQDAFLQLHAALDQIDGATHLKRWLLRTVTHRSIDRLRKDGQVPRWLRLDEANEPAAAECPDDPLAARYLRGLLRRLPPDAQAVVLLRFQEDLDPMEIASVLAMPHNTVKSHLRRSLEFLRAQQSGDRHVD